MCMTRAYKWFRGVENAGLFPLAHLCTAFHIARCINSMNRMPGSTDKPSVSLLLWVLAPWIAPHIPDAKYSYKDHAWNDYIPMLIVPPRVSFLGLASRLPARYSIYSTDTWVWIDVRSFAIRIALHCIKRSGCLSAYLFCTTIGCIQITVYIRPSLSGK